MAIKGFGVAIKLTLSGNNQLTHFSTYIFGFTVVCCIAIQMNYFNKALDLFSTNIVNPIYYVSCFMTSMDVSLINFQTCLRSSSRAQQRSRLLSCSRATEHPEAST